MKPQKLTRSASVKVRPRVSNVWPTAKSSKCGPIGGYGMVPLLVERGDGFDLEYLTALEQPLDLDQRRGGKIRREEFPAHAGDLAVEREIRDIFGFLDHVGERAAGLRQHIAQILERPARLRGRIADADHVAVLVPAGLP